MSAERLIPQNVRLNNVMYALLHQDVFGPPISKKWRVDYGGTRRCNESVILGTGKYTLSTRVAEEGMGFLHQSLAIPRYSSSDIGIASLLVNGQLNLVSLEASHAVTAIPGYTWAEVQYDLPIAGEPTRYTPGPSARLGLSDEAKKELRKRLGQKAIPEEWYFDLSILPGKGKFEPPQYLITSRGKKPKIDPVISPDILREAGLPVPIPSFPENPLKQNALARLDIFDAGVGPFSVTVGFGPLSDPKLNSRDCLNLVAANRPAFDFSIHDGATHIESTDVRAFQQS